MAANPNVLFKLLTAAQWEALTEKDNGTLYRVQKTGGGEDFYQGSNHLNNQAEINAAIAALTGTATIASKSGNVVTLKAGIAEASGVVSNNSDSDIVLAAVAATGASGDISYDNTTSGLTATDVQAAIDEVASQSSGGVDSKTVYVTETAGGSGDAFSKRYGVYQGANGSSSSPVVAEKLVDIDIPRDMVVEDGEVVDVVFKSSDSTLHEGSESGTDVTTEIMGSTTPTAANAGKYIKLTIANSAGTHLWIPAKDLVDIYTAQQSATQIQLAIDNNNEISATVVASSIGTTELAAGAVTTAKIDDEAVTTAKLDDGAVTTAKITDGNVTLGKLESSVQTSLGLADSAVQSVTASDPTTGTDGTITVDGTEVAVKGLGTAAFTNTSAYDVSGAAQTAETNANSYTDTALTNALTWETVSGS